MDLQPTPDENAETRPAFGTSESSGSSDVQGDQEATAEYETANDQNDGRQDNNEGSVTTIAGDEGLKMLSEFGGEADIPVDFVGRGSLNFRNSPSNPNKDREVSFVRGGVTRDLEEGPYPEWLLRATVKSPPTTVIREKRPWPPLWEPRHCPHDCRRDHPLDKSFWGPTADAGWNVSNLPAYRSPSSPRFRLFGAIKETRPGREPTLKAERPTSSPEQGPSRTHQPYKLRLDSLENWKSSNKVSPAPTYRQWRKLHPCATRNSLLNYGDLPPQIPS